MRDITEILTRALGVAGDEAEDKEDGSKEQGSGVRVQGAGTDG
jgi:hypothetical protein